MKLCFTIIYIKAQVHNEEIFISVRSYVIDERGLANNFVVEPKMYLQESSGIGLSAYAQKLNGRLSLLCFEKLDLLPACPSFQLLL